jgi:hypothetical protein
MPTCLSEPCEPQRGASVDARAGSLAYRGRRRKGAMDPLCGLIGWVRCVSRARRMNGVGEVGARVRVDKLKPWNYSSKVPFSPNPRWGEGWAQGSSWCAGAFVYKAPRPLSASFQDAIEIPGWTLRTARITLDAQPADGPVLPAHGLATRTRSHWQSAIPPGCSTR